MGASQVNISVVDKSTIVPALSGIYGIITIPSNKGTLKPFLATSQDEFIKEFGAPDPKLGVAQYSAMNYLTQSDKLWVKRVTHADAKLGGVLVKGKVESLPLVTPVPTYTVDKVVTPIPAGLTELEFEQFQFNLYHTNRKYSLLTIEVLENSITNTFRVNNHDGLLVGDVLSIGTTVDNNSSVFTITELVTSNVNFDKIKLNGNMTASINAPIRKVVKSAIAYNSPVTLTAAVNNNTKVLVNSATEVLVNHTILIGAGEYIVVSKNGLELTLSSPVTAAINAPVTLQKRTYTDVTGVTISRSVSGSNEILVTNSDLISNNDIITASESLITTSDLEFKVVSKDTYVEVQKFITVDNPISVLTTSVLHKMITSEYEDRECFLVVGANVGDWNNKISIGIESSKDYTNAFYLVVYSEGIEVERFLVSRKRQLDGYQRQMFIEDVVNGKSAYIKVKDNSSYIDDNNEPVLPLVTDYSIFRRIEEDLFVDTTTVILEDLVLGDTDIKVSSFINIDLGTRLKFLVGSDKLYDLNIDGSVKTNPDGSYKVTGASTSSVPVAYQSAEYKVINKYSSGGEYHIVLDRGIVESRIVANSLVQFFNTSLTSVNDGIFNGIKYYLPTKLPTTYPLYKIGQVLTISGVSGKLLDCGSNLLTYGYNGSTVTLGDMITGLNTFSNKDEYPGQIVLDGGFAHAAYASAINSLVIARGGQCHGFLSSDYLAEISTNYKTEIVKYFKSTAVDSDVCSFFSGWVEIFDPINQIYVMVSPESFASCSQSFTTRTYNIFTPAAGYIRGKMNGALEVTRRFSQGDMDYLVDNRINPIKYDNGALYIYGNETSYRKPSPLQLRSVAFLIIFMKVGLDGLLKYIKFDPNDEATWKAVEDAVSVFMEQEIKRRGGVYDYKVSVKDVTSPSDIDNRKLNLFVGIQPTMDTKFIDAKIAVFNKSADISISW